MPVSDSSVVMNRCSHEYEDDLSGLLVIDKPKGMISKDVSRILQKRVLPRKVRLGHVGSLDPLAQGVLPVTVGRATRLQPYILDSLKTYFVTVVFGFQTDTLDVTGTRTETQIHPPYITVEAANRVLKSFEGEHIQAPPLYSAVKYKGRRLYEYARAGRGHEVDLASLARSVHIHHIRLIQFSEVSCDHLDLRDHMSRDHLPLQTMDFVVECSKGTYVRSICDTMGHNLGVPTTMMALRRQKTGGVDETQAISVAELVRDPHQLGSALIPMVEIPLSMPRVSVSMHVSHRLRLGQRVRFEVDLDDPCSHPSLCPQLLPSSSGEPVSWHVLVHTQKPSDCLVVDEQCQVVCVGQLMISPTLRSRYERVVSTEDMEDMENEEGQKIHMVLKQKRGL